MDEEYNIYTDNNENIVEDEMKRKIKSHKSCKNRLVCCYKILVKHSLFIFFFFTFSNLTSTYQYLLILAVTQVACKRSFSTL